LHLTERRNSETGLNPSRLLRFRNKIKKSQIKGQPNKEIVKFQKVRWSPFFVFFQPHCAADQPVMEVSVPAPIFRRCTGTFSWEEIRKMNEKARSAARRLRHGHAGVIMQKQSCSKLIEVDAYVDKYL